MTSSEQDRPCQPRGQRHLPEAESGTHVSNISLSGIVRESRPRTWRPHGENNFKKEKQETLGLTAGAGAVASLRIGDENACGQLHARAVAARHVVAALGPAHAERLAVLEGHAAVGAGKAMLQEAEASVLGLAAAARVAIFAITSLLSADASVETWRAAGFL